MLVDLSQFWSIAGLTFLVGLSIQVGKLGPLSGPTLKPWLGVLSIVVGIGWALLIGWGIGAVKGPDTIVQAVLGGFIAGLAASGGYDLTLDKVKKWI